MKTNKKKFDDEIQEKEEQSLKCLIGHYYSYALYEMVL